MKILLIEDDVKTAAAVERGLTAEGYAVEVEGRGDDGVWRAQESRYDVIVLDIMLPGRNGFQVCADLRAVENWTPILMLTAKDGHLDEAEALDTGADDYLTKPFAFEVLLARVRALIRRGAMASPPSHEVAGLVFDEPGRRVFRGDAEIRLTAREFDVLSFLCRRPGQVLSKLDILAGVWPFEFDGDPNIVEVYIRRIRRKIDDPFDTQTIQTVRGAGYRLVEAGDG